MHLPCFSIGLIWITNSALLKKMQIFLARLSTNLQLPTYLLRFPCVPILSATTLSMAYRCYPLLVLKSQIFTSYPYMSLFITKTIIRIHAFPNIMSRHIAKETTTTIPLKKVWNKPTASAYLQIFGTGSGDTCPSVYLFADSQR